VRRRWNSQSDGIAADRTTKGIQRIGVLLENIGLNEVRGDERITGETSCSIIESIKSTDSPDSTKSTLASR
jgi:hypothetical protein